MIKKIEEVEVLKEKIFELFKQNIKNPKLYVTLFVIIMIVLILFPYIDANYFYYSRVEKRINILNEITELDENRFSNNEILQNEYLSILKEIEKQKDGSLGSVFITDNSQTVSRNKFLSGAVLSWVIAVVSLFIKMDKWWYKLVSLLFLGIIGIVLGYFSTIIPTIVSPKCNYIFMPIMQCVVFGMLITGGNNI